MQASVWIPATLILIGAVGIVVPALPGLPLVVLGVLVWTLMTGTALAWAVLVVAVLLWLGALAAKVALPGRQLRNAGVGRGALVLAMLLGTVGFFVVPVVGGVAGFVLGIYLAEVTRWRSSARAWTATKAAVRAVLASIGIELLAAAAIATTWVVGVAVSA